MMLPHFMYLTYNPCVDTVDAAKDWLRFPYTTTDYELALSQPFRIAAVTPFYNDPSFVNYNSSVPTVDLSVFDLVLVSDPEYYTQAEILTWIKQQGIKNYLVALGGLRNKEVIAPDVIYRPYWLTKFLTENTEFIETYSDTKPYLFEALLGSQRPHRDYVMLAMTKTGLLDKSIVTYRDCFPGGIHNDISIAVAQEFPGVELQRPYVSANLQSDWEVRSNIDNTISFILPNKIYQATHYSIVCETLGEGNDFFFSEKIMKAMFAKRPFVLFGPQGYLEKLRNFGFATFDCYLDESYDYEVREVERWKKAMQQVMRLAWLERPNDVQQKVKYVLDQNFERLHSWRVEYQSKMVDMLMTKISGEHINWDGIPEQFAYDNYRQ